MLKVTVLVLAAAAISIAMLWLQQLAGPVGQFVEQHFVVLTVALLIPVLTPWLE